MASIIVPASRAHFIAPVPKILIVFTLIMLLVEVGEGIMSYATPIFLESHLNSELAMGLVMASSAAVGIISDIIIGGWFRQRKFEFFLVWTFLASLSFPLALNFLPPILPVFVFAVGLWGISFELIQFTNYKFIEASTKPHQHASAWGVVSAFKALAYTLSPLIASFLLEGGARTAFQGALGFYAVGTTIAIIFVFVHKNHRTKADIEPMASRSVLHEFRIWKTMIHRIWHLLFFVFTLGVIDATFWTVGTLLSEEVGNGGDHGLLLVMYGLPVLFIGIFAGWASRPFGKKRAAFLCGIGSGTMLTLAGLTRDHNLLLVFVFLSSMFLAISWPEIYAVFEDYVCRLGKTSNDMIGLQSSTMAMAYLIGPILAGGIASVVGRQQTFTVVGILLVIISVLALIIVPRKIRLPQAELTKLIV